MLGRALADMMVGTSSDKATGTHGVRRRQIVSMRGDGCAKKMAPGGAMEITMPETAPSSVLENLPGLAVHVGEPVEDGQQVGPRCRGGLGRRGTRRLRSRTDRDRRRIRD